ELYVEDDWAVLDIARIKKHLVFHLSKGLAVPTPGVGGLRSCIGGTKRFFFFLGRLPTFWGDCQKEVHRADMDCRGRRRSTGEAFICNPSALEKITKNPLSNELLHFPC
ncbi:MAG: hypothetical protein AAFR66_25410, partial [Bacteroidota bacterium]